MEPEETRPRHLLPLALVLLATALTFGPSLTNGFVRDDWPLIVQNELIRDPAHLPDILRGTFWNVSSQTTVGRGSYLNFYRPVVSLAYVTEFQLFAEAPLGYHVVNLLLHLACVLFGAVFLRRRLDAPPRAAWTAAAVGILPFALHPSRPESVTWISGSTDLWMTFWVLIGLLAIEESRPLLRALGTTAFALAVLSKEAAVVVPVLVLADAVLLHRRRPLVEREGLSVVGVIVAVVVHLSFVPYVSSDEGTSNGASRFAATLGHFVHRTGYWFDPSIEPVPREFDPTGHELFAPWALALGAALIASAVLLAVFAVRSRAARPWLADLLFFVVPLLPVANAVGLEGPSVVVDRYLYFPLLGVGALLARAAVTPLREPRRRVIVGALALGLAASFAIPTMHFARAFESDAALWRFEYERNPASFEALEGTARAALDANDLATALARFDACREVARAHHVRDREVTCGLRTAVALISRTSDAEQGQLSALRDALDAFERAPILALHLPDREMHVEVPEPIWRNIRSHTDLVGIPRATAHVRTGRLAEAEAQLQNILRDEPRNAAAFQLLIAVYGRQGRWDEAAEAHSRASHRLPGDPSIVGMGAALTRAREMSARAVPDEPTRAIRDARVQRELGSPEGARRILDDAMARYPNHASLILERAQTDVADARFDLARAVLERARAADPANDANWALALRRLAEAEALSRARRR